MSNNILGIEKYSDLLRAGFKFTSVDPKCSHGPYGGVRCHEDLRISKLLLQGHFTVCPLGTWDLVLRGIIRIDIFNCWQKPLSQDSIFKAISSQADVDQWLSIN